ncbi:MAG: polyprenyl diphosphate synthase [Minisyncoccia bacterium]
MSGSGEHKPVACIGIILDGNRRWAKEKGLPSLEGHRRGFELLKDAARWVRDRGVPHLAVFAFSTENWNRTAEEVSYLMDIFRDAIRDSSDELGKEGIRVRFIGERERFADDIKKGIVEAEEKTKENTKMTLWICLSYGARAEIVAAAQAASAHDGMLTEELLRQHFWSAEMPDPDIIIRTGGARRLSNFLLWQAAYSELFFIEPFWPDFSEKILDEILAEYAERERRMGK